MEWAGPTISNPLKLQKNQYNNMTTQGFSDNYILVPRSSVSARTSESETQIRVTPQVTTVAPAAAQSTSSVDSKAVSSKPPSSTLSAKVLALMAKPLSGNNGPCATSLTAVYQDFIPSGGYVDYFINLYVDLCSEFANFKQVFEQYRVSRIDATTWTGELTNRFQNSTSAANCNGLAIASGFSRQPVTAAVTFTNLCDMNNTKLLEYGTTKNAHKQHLKTDGCFTLDTASSPSNYVHQSGWLETNNADKHIWGTFLQNSNMAAISGTTALWHIFRFQVEFRRRRFQT